MPSSSAPAARKNGAQYSQKLLPVLREYQMNRIEKISARPATVMSRAKRGAWMVQPLSAPKPEMMTASAITLPAQVPPNIALAASENGAVALASLEAGRMPNTAISDSRYTTAVAIVPRTVARGMLRSGLRTLAAATAAVSTP